MALLQQLNPLPASLGGVEFFCEGESQDFGRKTVPFEYPDSNRRYVEDLGESLGKFTVSAVVYTDNSIDETTPFENVIKQGGIQQLILPYVSRFIDVQVTNCVRTSSNSKVGRIEFNVTFLEVTSNLFPVADVSNRGLLSQFKQASINLIGEDFKTAYNNVNNSREKLLQASGEIQSLSTQIQSLANTTQGSASGFSDFSRNISNLINSASSLAKAPDSLVEQVQTVFLNLDNSYENALDLFNLLDSTTQNTTNENSYIGNSKNSQDIVENKNALTKLFQETALASSYESAINIDYNNLEELLSVKFKLKNNYDNLYPNIENRLTRKNLQSLAIQTDKVLSNISLTLPTIETITVRDIPLVVLVYELYGNLDRLEEVKNLNNIVNTSSVRGEIKVLSS